MDLKPCFLLSTQPWGLSSHRNVAQHTHGHRIIHRMRAVRWHTPALAGRPLSDGISFIFDSLVSASLDKAISHFLQRCSGTSSSDITRRADVVTFETSQVLCSRVYTSTASTSPCLYDLISFSQFSSLVDDSSHGHFTHVVHIVINHLNILKGCFGRDRYPYLGCVLHEGSTTDHG